MNKILLIIATFLSSSLALSHGLHPFDGNYQLRIYSDHSTSPHNEEIGCFEPKGEITVKEGKFLGVLNVAGQYDLTVSGVVSNSGEIQGGIAVSQINVAGIEGGFIQDVDETFYGLKAIGQWSDKTGCSGKWLLF